MFKKMLPLAAVGLVVLGFNGTARAQHLDLSQMVQANLAFERQFDLWARQGSMEVARQLRMSGQQNPFNAMTISQATRDGNRAFEGYIRNAQINSHRTSEAIGNWTNGAIRGNGPYQDPYSGALYNLPWTHNQYHINQYGQAVPGFNPYRTNVHPYYGR